MLGPALRPLNLPARVTGFWLSYAAIFLGLGLVLGLAPAATRLLVAGLLVTTASLALTYAFTRAERLTLTDVGAAWARGSVVRFTFGVVFGFAMIALLIALSRLVLGPLSFVRSPGVDTSALALMCVTYAALAAGEELGFRGYPFHRLRDRYGVVMAQVTVALAFAVYHMLQGWPAVNALVGTTAGSVLFGMATLASGGLAFPIGIHAAWNIGSWAMGTKSEVGYWRMELTHTPSFVEGAAVYLAVMVASILTLWWWIRSGVIPTPGKQ